MVVEGAEAPAKKPGFGAHATTAMFVGLCAAYIGAYVGKVIPREGSDIMPIIVAIVAAAAMAAILFGEGMTSMQLLGGALILGGVLYYSRGGEA